MSLQIIKDSSGNNAGVFIPMEEWNILSQKHTDLLDLIDPEFYSEKQIQQMASNFKLTDNQLQMLENASLAGPERYRTLMQLKEHIQNKHGVRV